LNRRPPSLERGASRDPFWPAATGLLSLAVGLLLFDLGTKAQELGRLGASLKWQLAGLGGLFIFLACLALFALTWTRAWGPIASRLGRAQEFLLRMGALNLLPPALFCGVYLSLVYFPTPFLFKDPAMFAGLWARLGLTALVGLLSAPFLRAAFPRVTAAQSVALGCAAAGVLYKAAGFISAVSPSPFTIGWSEASRFYYGSLFQSAALYGQAFPLPFLHPSRYLLLSLPFLIPGLPIWAHRLWQVLLWLGMTALTSWLLVRRLKFKEAPTGWIAAAYAFLFIFQGPVYYHLLVCVVPVLAWFDSRRFTRSLLVVAAASAWAGISRINWIPMPAFLALMLYLLETPFAGRAAEGAKIFTRSIWAYLRSPLAWGAAGIAAALAANAAYIALSGQPDTASFASSFTSDLLWYRLLPSPTYPPGILPMALLLSAPLWTLILLNLRRAEMHPLRLLGLAGMTLVMFAGGLVVSTKIGGGSNLHNLDAYLILLVVWGGCLLARRTVPDSLAASPPGRLEPHRPWWLVVLIFAMPLVPLLLEGRPLRFENQAALRAEAAQLCADVDSAAAGAGGRPVLFIWQRQLLTFREVRGVELIYEYETVDLMEMAMANNRPYLEEFYRQLADHRFALIVAQAQNDVIKGPKDAFPEENNVWVERITRPILQYYQPRYTLPISGTQILIPKP
jgi:hypothetical protein